MDELEEIRMRKLQQDMESQQEAMQQLAQLEVAIKQRMTKEALQRYGNIKSAHPEKALQLLAVLGRGIETGQLKIVDDEFLKSILTKLQPEKKDFNIRRS